MKKTLNFPLLLIILVSLGLFVGCSGGNDNMKKAEDFIKQIYIPEEDDVFVNPEGTNLGEGTDGETQGESKLDKYMDDKFKPLMTNDGYEKFKGVNPLIWLGMAKNEDNMDINLSDFKVTKVDKEKSSDEFEYYNYEFKLEYKKDGNELESQDINGEIRLTKDGLVDELRQGVPVQIPY